jgi:hypothetical protein
MTIKWTLGAAIAVACLLGARGTANASPFVADQGPDTQYFTAESNGTMDNQDPAATHILTADGGILFFEPHSLYVGQAIGTTSAGTVTCQVSLMNLATRESTIVSNSSSNAFFILQFYATVPSIGYYQANVRCWLPPRNNATNGVAGMFAYEPRADQQTGVSSGGWMPSDPGSLSSIQHSYWYLYNTDGANAHYASTALSTRSLAAGTHGITFYGQWWSTPTVCQLTLRNITTHGAYTATISVTQYQVYSGVSAQVSVPVAGTYDIGLVCKVPNGAALYSAAGFN